MWGGGKCCKKKKTSDLAENMYQFAKSSKPGKRVVAQSISTRDPKLNDMR